jgi:hypothetical protein
MLVVTLALAQRDPVAASLITNGGGGFLIEREYSGTGDLEGITQIETAPPSPRRRLEWGRTERDSRGVDGTSGSHAIWTIFSAKRRHAW